MDSVEVLHISGELNRSVDYTQKLDSETSFRPNMVLGVRKLSAENSKDVGWPRKPIIDNVRFYM